MLEVLIFLTIFSLFFVAAASVVSVILNNLKIQEHKIMAVRYSEELLEWLRGEKEESWSNFVNYAGESTNEKTYCFPQSPIGNWPLQPLIDPNECTYDGLFPPIYRRTATLITNPEKSQVTLKINVSWKEANKEFNIPIESVFTLWE